MKDAELRTGLTAKEVGQFGFAARAVGQDISIVERLMRGLSTATRRSTIYAGSLRIGSRSPETSSRILVSHRETMRL